MQGRGLHLQESLVMLLLLKGLPLLQRGLHLPGRGLHWQGSLVVLLQASGLPQGSLVGLLLVNHLPQQARSSQAC